MNIELILNLFEEGTGATDDRQAREEDNDMFISFLHRVEWKQL